VLLLACEGRSAEQDAGALREERSGELRIQTEIVETREHLEQWQAEALAAYRRGRDAGEQHVLSPPAAQRPMRAAARSRLAEIEWSARYPHGSRVTPRVTMSRHIIRCEVEISGPTPAEGDTDRTTFKTRIQPLEPASYRIIAGSEEVTLGVPETFIP
jgi:hypothetical protein